MENNNNKAVETELNLEKDGKEIAGGKLSDLTESVASVKVEDLENRSTTDAVATLRGKASGVAVYQTSGAPGSCSVHIRVQGSINA